ncbi:hypothetical protein ACWDX6_30540 [Streptomyces sp. NPDC003027]
MTEQWAARLRSELPDVASDVARLQAMRVEWQDTPPADRSFELGGCTDPNCHGVHRPLGSGGVSFPSAAGVRVGAGRGSVWTGR